MAKQIIVCKLGWVLVGDVFDPASPHGSLTITSTAVVRVWGTERGLGELAAKGPTKTTVLDPCGTVTVERDAMLFRIDCEESAWRRKK